MRWTTEDDEQMMDWYRQGKRTRWIAEQMGRTEYAVRRRLHLRGVRRSLPTGVVPVDDAIDAIHRGSRYVVVYDGHRRMHVGLSHFRMLKGRIDEERGRWLYTCYSLSRLLNIPRSRIRRWMRSEILRYRRSGRTRNALYWIPYDAVQHALSDPRTWQDWSPHLISNDDWRDWAIQIRNKEQ